MPGQALLLMRLQDHVPIEDAGGTLRMVLIRSLSALATSCLTTLGGAVLTPQLLQLQPATTVSRAPATDSCCQANEASSRTGQSLCPPLGRE